MPKDQREIRRAIRMPAKREDDDSKGKVIEGQGPRTLTDEDDVAGLSSAELKRLTERGAIEGFVASPKHEETESTKSSTAKGGKK